LVGEGEGGAIVRRSNATEEKREENFTWPLSFMMKRGGKKKESPPSAKGPFSFLRKEKGGKRVGTFFSFDCWLRVGERGINLHYSLYTEVGGECASFL